MSEAELWELVIACNDTGLTAIVLYLTTASSYLVAAFLVGTKLTEYQVTVVSGLFVVFAGLFTYFTIGYTIMGSKFPDPNERICGLNHQNASDNDFGDRTGRIHWHPRLFEIYVGRAASERRMNDCC